MKMVGEFEIIHSECLLNKCVLIEDDTNDEASSKTGTSVDSNDPHLVNVPSSNIAQNLNSISSSKDPIITIDGDIKTVSNLGANGISSIAFKINKANEV